MNEMQKAVMAEVERDGASRSPKEIIDIMYAKASEALRELVVTGKVNLTADWKISRKSPDRRLETGMAYTDAMAPGAGR